MIKQEKQRRGRNESFTLKMAFDLTLLSNCFTYWNIYYNGCHSSCNKIVLFITSGLSVDLLSIDYVKILKGSVVGGVIEL